MIKKLIKREIKLTYRNFVKKLHISYKAHSYLLNLFLKFNWFFIIAVSELNSRMPLVPSCGCAVSEKDRKIFLYIYFYIVADFFLLHNQCVLRQGFFPSQWKVAQIIMIQIGRACRIVQANQFTACPIEII